MSSRRVRSCVERISLLVSLVSVVRVSNVIVARVLSKRVCSCVV